MFNIANITRANLRLSSCIVILLVTGCATAPERNAIEISQPPTHWSTENPVNSPIITQWLSSFADPGLNALVQEALNNNYDLKAAAARMTAAHEQARIDGAPRWPQISFAPEYQRSNLTFKETGAFDALFMLSWEIDVWGRIKATQQAAGQEAEAVAADYNGGRLSLAARTAQSYFELIEANLQAEVAEQSIKDRRTIVELVRGRFARGRLAAWIYVWCLPIWRMQKRNWPVRVTKCKSLREDWKRCWDTIRATI
jgi:outer membrane protein TolC